MCSGFSLVFFLVTFNFSFLFFSYQKTYYLTQFPNSLSITSWLLFASRARIHNDLTQQIPLKKLPYIRISPAAIIQPNIFIKNNCWSGEIAQSVKCLQENLRSSLRALKIRFLKAARAVLTLKPVPWSWIPEPLPS